MPKIKKVVLNSQNLPKDKCYSGAMKTKFQNLRVKTHKKMEMLDRRKTINNLEHIFERIKQKGF